MHQAAIEYCALSGRNSKHSLWCTYLARGEIRTRASKEGTDEGAEFCNWVRKRSLYRLRHIATLTKNSSQETLGGRIFELRA